jgi:hypothetical protein
VDSTLENGTDYKVRVSDQNNATVYGESAQFAIKEKSITVSEPKGTSAWSQGIDAEIKWTTKDGISKVKIDLYEWSTWKQAIVLSTENDGSYTWTVESTLSDSSNYRVRVSDADDSTTYGESAYFKIEKKSITVTSPGWGTKWSQGVDAEVKWSSTGAVSKVKIDLYEAGTWKQAIVSSTENDGSYIWTVDSKLPESTTYKVRVSDFNDATVYGESVQFTIEKKSLTVTEPTNSTKWSQGVSGNIYWSWKGAISYVKIDLYKGTALKQAIVSSTENDGSYTWSPVESTLEDGTDYKVRISDSNDATVCGESAQFTVEARSITVTKPTSSTYWAKGYSGEVNWTSTGNISYVKIDLYKGTVFKQAITTSTSNNGSYTWWTVSSTLESGTDYKVRVSDYNSAAVYGESAQFEIGPPSITVTEPTASTVWVKGKSGAMTWTWKGNISSVKIELYKGTTFKQTITTWASNSGSYTWTTVDSTLEDGTDYKVRVSDQNNATVYGESAQFAIKEKSITVSEPKGTSAWSQGIDAEIKWTTKDGISKVKIDLYESSTWKKAIVSSTDNDGSYTWTVDSTLSDSTGYKVRVSDANDSTTYGESPNFKIEKKSITVTSPGWGTKWTQGLDAEVKWSSTGAVSKVKIDLYEAGTWKQAIVSSTENDGSYTWTVDSKLPESTTYKVRVSDFNDATVYGESAQFTVEKKSLTISEPTSSTKWSQGGSGNISWTWKGAISYVKIDLYKGGTWKQLIVSSTENDGSYTWTVSSTLENGTDYKVRISDFNDATVYRDSVEFTIEPRSITLTKPISTTYWAKGYSGEVNWASTGNISSIKIDLYKGTTLKQTIATWASNNASYTWWTVSSTLDDGTDYKVRVSDQNDATVYGDSAQFEIGPASITVTEPTTSTVWVKGKSAAITWTWKGNISTIKIELYKGTTFKRTITTYASNSGSYAWPTVDSTLENGTDYKIRVFDYNNATVYGESTQFEIK